MKPETHVFLRHHYRHSDSAHRRGPGWAADPAAPHHAPGAETSAVPGVSLSQATPANQSAQDSSATLATPAPANGAHRAHLSFALAADILERRLQSRGQ